jgi:outer membrane protein TolC
MRDGGKRRLAALLALSVSLTLHPSLGAEVGALTLDGCYRLALERSETLALGEEEIRRAEGRYEQVRAAALPRLGARGTYL